MATKQKQETGADGALQAFPDDLQEWLEEQRGAGLTARLDPVGKPDIKVDHKGGIVGTPPASEWDGPHDAPLWAGYPFVGYEGAAEGSDPKALQMLGTPVAVAVGGFMCWKVADDPACHCGVFLRADVYGPHAKASQKDEEDGA